MVFALLAFGALALALALAMNNIYKKTTKDPQKSSSDEEDTQDEGDHDQGLKILRGGSVSKSCELGTLNNVDEQGLEKSSGDTVPRSQCTKPSLEMICGSHYLPKLKELRPEGEDAHFICTREQTIGVADGVRGWKYSRELMRKSKVAIRYQHAINSGVVDLRKVLKEAYKSTNSKGSSTACIVTLQNGGILHFVSVGDSSVMVFRNCKFLYRSPCQQRGSYHPYQLGNSWGCDHPSAAREVRIQLHSGDVIVVGTNGLFDNMYPSEMEQVLVENTKESRVEPDVLACILADLAWNKSRDKTFFRPFVKATKEAGKERPEGKTDDITVVVGYVTAFSLVWSNTSGVDRPMKIISDSVLVEKWFSTVNSQRLKRSANVEAGLPCGLFGMTSGKPRESGVSWEATTMWSDLQESQV